MASARKSPREPNGLRQQAEAVVPRRNAGLSKALAKEPGDTLGAIHELQVHQIELELQNEELRRVQVELDALRARYFDLYDLAPVGYCTLSEKGLILEANLMAASLLGTSRITLIGQSFTRFLFPEDADRYHLHWKQILETEEPKAWEQRLVKCAASTVADPPFWAQVTGTLSRDGEGLSVIRLVLSDVSERREGDIKARDEQKRLRTIIDTAATPLFVKDNDHRIVLANPAFCDIFGIEESAILGRTLGETIPDAELRHFFEVDRRVLDTGEPYQREEARTIKGRSCTLITTKVRFVEESGKRYLVGSIHDITERKRAEESLRIISTAVEQSPVSIVITDTTGAIEYLNPKFTEMTGYAAAEALGQNPRILKGEKIPLGIYKELWDTILAGITWTGEFHNRKKNGELFWEQASISPIKDSLGVITHFVAIKEDITARKQVEATLRESNELIRQFISQSPIHAYIKEVTPEQSRVLLASDNFTDMIGIPGSEMVGKTMTDLFPADMAAKFAEDDWEVVSNGQGLVIEEEFNGRIYSTLKFPIVQSEKTLLAGFSIDITAREQSKRLLSASQEQLRILLARLQRAQEEERIRVSREIHDELGQQLTGLKMDVRWLERKLSEPGLPPVLNPLLDRVVGTSELADAMIATVQRIAAELRPSTLDRLGLQASLSLEARRFQERSGTRCSVACSGPFPELDSDSAIDMFYIFREALTNVERHAQATEVQLDCRSEGGMAVFTITDDGVGMEPLVVASPHSLGLTGMQERAVKCGGTLAFERNTPCGARVVVRFPWTLPDGEGNLNP